MVILRACAVGAALLVGTACGDGDQRPAEEAEQTSSSTTTTTVEPDSTTTEAPSTTRSVDLDPDTQAGIDFIDAWSRGDTDAMRELAPADQVDTAMRLGTAVGESDCSSQSSGQYQCVVGVSDGKRAYLLIGEPGDRAGRVWWIAEYVPGT
jgi:hypothetical protein